MLKTKNYQFWFCTGSQDLYGDELCFVEFNPNHEEDERVCIGAYRSNQDDPTYYAPYMAAERNANNE